VHSSSPKERHRWSQRLYTDLATSGDRSGKGLSPRSVRLAHQVLQQAFAKAVQWKLTENNPLASGIILPRMEPKEMKTLSAQDAKAFLDATAEDRLGRCSACYPRPVCDGVRPSGCAGAMSTWPTPGGRCARPWWR
jgi:integrase